MSNLICERHGLSLGFFDNITNLNRVAEDWTVCRAMYALSVEVFLYFPRSDDELVGEFENDAEK